jgi:hypothetical protein
MKEQNLNPLTLFCLVSGHNPAEAGKHGDVGWYAATGLAMLSTASLSALSAYELLHTAMRAGSGFGLVGAILAFVFVYIVDLFINMTPRLGDGIRHRLALLVVRGPMGLVIAAIVGLGTTLNLNQDDVRAYVAQQAASVSAADVNAYTRQAPQTKQIREDNAQIRSLTRQDNKLVATAGRKKARWWQDMVPCHSGGSLTCQGDIPGWGPNSHILYADYKTYLTTVLRPTEKANEGQIATLRADIKHAQQTLGAAQERLAKAESGDTNLAAETRALVHIMSHNWVLWILPLVILAWDQTVVLSKVLFPRRPTEIAEQERREDHARARAAAVKEAELLQDERASNPDWQAARDEYHTHAAAAWLAQERAQLAAVSRALEHDADGAAIPTPRIDARPTTTAMRPVAALVTVAALAIAGLAAARLTQGHASSHVMHERSVSSLTSAGKPITIQVGPSRPVDVSVPEVGTLVAASDSFSRSGTMTITPRKARPPARDGVAVSGTGLDVTFSGTKLTKPVTLTFAKLPKPSSRALPVIAHRADDGVWDYQSAAVTADGIISGSTSHFSLNMPGWVASSGQWVSDIGHWIGDRLASALAGRTPPLTCSGAPSWFHVVSTYSDLVHVCARDAGPDSGGVDRAEIQIKSNRGVSLQVNVPGDPQYVWVEGQPWPLRQVVMGALEQDPNQTVILPAGATMTIGYIRTPSDQNLTATVSGYTGLALLDTVIRQALGFALDNVNESTEESFVGYTIFKCATGFQPALVTSTPSFSDDGIAGVLKCMFSQAVSTLVSSSDSEAINFVQQVKSSISADALATTAKAVRAAAIDVTVLLPALQDSAGNLWDAVESWASGGASNQVSFSIDGSNRPATTSPATPGPSPSPEGSYPGPGLQTGGHVAPSPELGSGGTDNGGPGTSSPGSSASPTPSSQPHTFYNNYGPATEGVPMCRGNPANPGSMPGGTVTQTFTADANGIIDSAKVQIDPDKTVTATAVLSVNGTEVGSNSEAATGDVTFTFSPVTVKAGDPVSLKISFTATYGSIITVYEAGNPGGNFSVTNSCPAGAAAFTRSDAGLRAVLSGTS